jgi:hypothetical protein
MLVQGETAARSRLATPIDAVGEFTAGRQTAMLKGLILRRLLPRGASVSLESSPVPDVPELTAFNPPQATPLQSG